MSNSPVDELADFHHDRGAYANQSWVSDRIERFLERNVVIPKADLPEVKRSKTDPNSYNTDGQNIVFTSVENARAWLMRDVAVWQFLEAEHIAEFKKNAERDKRRDDLAREFVNDGDYAYRFAEEPLKLAIDRILDLEAAS